MSFWFCLKIQIFVKDRKKVRYSNHLDCYGVLTKCTHKTGCMYPHVRLYISVIDNSTRYCLGHIFNLNQSANYLGKISIYCVVRRTISGPPSGSRENTKHLLPCAYLCDWKTLTCHYEIIQQKGVTYFSTFDSHGYANVPLSAVRVIF